MNISHRQGILFWLHMNFSEDVHFSKEKFISHKTPNGTKFDILCSGGVKQEGKPVPLLCATEDLADLYYREALKRYIETHKPGMLCWRTLPYLETINYEPSEGRSPRYFIYSRLCIERR